MPEHAAYPVAGERGAFQPAHMRPEIPDQIAIRTVVQHNEFMLIPKSIGQFDQMAEQHAAAG